MTVAIGGRVWWSVGSPFVVGDRHGRVVRPDIFDIDATGAKTKRPPVARRAKSPCCASLHAAMAVTIDRYQRKLRFEVDIKAGGQAVAIAGKSNAMDADRRAGAEYLERRRPIVRDGRGSRHRRRQHGNCRCRDASRSAHVGASTRHVAGRIARVREARLTGACAGP